MGAQIERQDVADARRVVVKLGTRVLTYDAGGLALARMFEVIEAIAHACDAGREVILVSSGAVGFGVQALSLDETPRDLAGRQACAAVGQGRLMGLYEAGFGRLDRRVGQILLSQSDFDDRLRYLNLRNTLDTLLAHGVVPIVNENDAVSTEELVLRGLPVDGTSDKSSPAVFGDNDRLSALVASHLGAELLVLLTDVDGVYDRDPRAHPDAERLDTLALTTDVEASDAHGATSRGGMRSKVDSARIAARAGCHAVIASGREPGTLAAVLAGEAVGTWVPSVGSLSARRRWIAWAAASRGVLHLDAGAVRALRRGSASLLAIGVTGVDGAFDKGDVVELRGPRGALVGRAMVPQHSDRVRERCAGETAPDGPGRGGVRSLPPLVRREFLVLEQSPPHASSALRSPSQETP